MIRRIGKDPPIGRPAFRDGDFQWSRDSKTLYLIRDEHVNSGGAQSLTTKSELWRYHLGNRTLEFLFRPFDGHQILLGRGAAVYFTAAGRDGRTGLMKFDGTQIAEADRPILDVPFYSFPPSYTVKITEKTGVSWRIDDSLDRLQRLAILGRPCMAFTLGKGFKGGFYCASSDRGQVVLLPGDRYLFLNAEHCPNAAGQILIDTVTCKYMRLPKETVVYRTMNTDIFQNFRLTAFGIQID